MLTSVYRVHTSSRNPLILLYIYSFWLKSSADWLQKAREWDEKSEHWALKPDQWIHLGVLKNPHPKSILSICSRTLWKRTYFCCRLAWDDISWWLYTELWIRPLHQKLGKRVTEENHLLHFKRSFSILNHIQILFVWLILFFVPECTRLHVDYIYYRIKWKSN